MRVLHVGWGFWPWRIGGLIHYADDLMAAQVARGDEVAYFFAGRHYARPRRSRVKRWRNRGVAMYELVNGPIVSGLELGTRRPALDVDEPRSEEAFRSVLRSFRPDVVHFQELLCLPSSLIDVAADAGVPTVMTLQDYGPLCTTLRLFDADGQICTRLRVGEDCAVRNARAPASRRPFVEDTLRHDIPIWRHRLRGHRWPRRFDRLTERVTDWSLRKVDAEEPLPGETSPAAFQRRRDVNVERLGRVGRLVAQSPRVGEIYRARGVAPERMTTFPFTLAHIERLRPRSLGSPPDTLTFTTLGGCASPTKGSNVIVGALRELRETGLEGRFRLLVYGGIHGDVRAELESFEGVELPEMYPPGELDSILDAVDVGIMPSIWEEALGYTGLEMVAKGIPLIANPLGGIVEYAREGETAWHNHSCSGEGLAEVMATLITEPERVVDMHRSTVAARDRVVPAMDDHVRAIYGAYRAAGGASPAADPLP
ncbi:MAG TPA: glycosyltransferase [Thermoleophilaceae bacterium]|nr:glycosyltransferase [Thermoleophilaceae bacterium]